MAQFNPKLLEISLNQTAIKQKAKQLQQIALSCDDESKIQSLVLAVNCIDLTTLGGDDTACNVARLCHRANNPLAAPILDALSKRSIGPVTTGAVCVYPNRVSDARKYLDSFQSSLPIASVVTGFPAGQGIVACTLEEIRHATQNGAQEIDIVINRTLALDGEWKQLFDEIRSVVEVCKETGAHLKTIISTGELATLENVYKSGMVAMMAGSDFIKTSTGKESINAKLVYGLVMTRAIRDFYNATGVRVGLKPAGGLKDSNDALAWLTLIRTQLGGEWMNNKLFRIGASSMLANIEAELFRLTVGKKPKAVELSF